MDQTQVLKILKWGDDISVQDKEDIRVFEHLKEVITFTSL